MSVKNELANTTINKDIIELADRISSSLTMDKTTGVAAVPADLYIQLLPEGLTEEAVQMVQTHTVNMTAASLLSLGEAAIPVLKKNAAINHVTLDVPMIGKDKIQLNFERSRQIPYTDKDGVATTHPSYGTSNVKIDTYGVGKRGDLKKIREFLISQATESFGK